MAKKHFTLGHLLKIFLFLLGGLLCLTSCKVAPPPHGTGVDQMQQSLREGAIIDKRIEDSHTKLPKNVSDALIPSVASVTPSSSNASQHRFDVEADKIPARSFFMGLVEGTPYNMVVNPEVKGEITLNLKNVTLEEAMDAVSDIYGYDFRRTTYGYEILPQQLQTQIFTINYLDVKRTGKSLVQITNTSISDKIGSASVSSGSGGGGVGGGGTITNATDVGNTQAGSSVQTQSEMDFWKILQTSVEQMVGSAGGRSVFVNAQAGLIIVHAFPQEIKRVAAYLDRIQSSLQRQVIIEAKILEVTLNDQFQSGVDWSAFGNPQGAGALFQQTGNAASPVSPGFFTLNYKGTFRALINLLQQQGNVQVLSSPRISTVNNQKAVIRVGSDAFFVTGVSTSFVQNGLGGATIPTSSVGLTPFFSGITLDVTPQISKYGTVILHIHPSVSEVTQQNTSINLGNSSGIAGANNTLQLPLAASTIRESDNIVRALNGQVVVIAGLMKTSMTETTDSVPGMGRVPFFGSLFRSSHQKMEKTELIILLRPVLAKDSTWTQSMQRADNNLQAVRRGFHFGGLPDDFGTEAEVGQ